LGSLSFIIRGKKKDGWEGVTGEEKGNEPPVKIDNQPTGLKGNGGGYSWSLTHKPPSCLRWEDGPGRKKPAFLLRERTGLKEKEGEAALFKEAQNHRHLPFEKEKGSRYEEGGKKESEFPLSPRILHKGPGYRLKGRFALPPSKEKKVEGQKGKNHNSFLEHSSLALNSTIQEGGVVSFPLNRREAVGGAQRGKTQEMNCLMVQRLNPTAKSYSLLHP